MKHYLSWMHAQAGADGILFCKLPDGKDTFWLNLGDWCAPDKKQPPRDLVHTFYLWRCTDFMARIATALGKGGDACTYRMLAEKTAAAFHAKFYDAEKGTYGPVGGDVFALVMGVPQERLARVRQALANNMEANGGHLDTGIFGTSFLFETLCDQGLNEAAYRAMDKRTRPGFGWWVEQGWTTTSEYWEGGGSRNHPMFGGGLSWLYRRLAGLQADESAPGYRRLIVRPYPVGDVTRASYATRTPYGEASAAWERSGPGMTLQLEIPVGSTARVLLPAFGKVMESGVPVGQSPDVKVIRRTDDVQELETGSGHYTFAVAP
jgi:alpha-L-rhamnosidase